MANKSVKSLIATILEINANDLDEQSGLNVTENWDSLNQFMITSAIESEFGIKLTFAELEDLSTLQKIFELFDEKGIEYDQ